jgi:hypothetical protein
MSVVKGMASEDVSWILERTTSGTIYRIMHTGICPNAGAATGGCQ